MPAHPLCFILSPCRVQQVAFTHNVLQLAGKCPVTTTQTSTVLELCLHEDVEFQAAPAAVRSQGARWGLGAHSLVTDLRRAIPLDTHSLSLCSLATSGKHCGSLGTEVMHQIKRAAPHRVLFWRCFEPYNSSLVPSGLEILQGGHKARSLNWKFYSLLLLKESSSHRLRCLFCNPLRNHLGWAGVCRGCRQGTGGRGWPCCRKAAPCPGTN